MFAMRRYVVVNRRRAGLWDADSNGPLTWTWGDATYDSPPPFAIGLGVVRRQRDIGPRPELYEMHAVKAPGSDWRDIMVGSLSSSNLTVTVMHGVILTAPLSPFLPNLAPQLDLGSAQRVCPNPSNPTP